MSDEVEDGNFSPPENSGSSTPDQEVQAASPPELSDSIAPAPADLTPVGDESETLPEWEELTPELLEDECLRGDFMLRWATILLAVLLGWSYLTETSVLVEAKSGQYMLDHGILPPRVDPFSAPTSETLWVNLNWGTDLFVGLIHRLGGFHTLTVFSALKIGLTFWILSRITYPGVTTWWPAVCAGVAVIAAFPAYQPGTMSITLLGLSLMLLLLHRLDLKPESKELYALPAMMVLWANMDPRAWVGSAFLLIYTLIGLLTQPMTRRQLILLTAAFVLPAIIHPWPLQPALGFQHMVAAATESQAQGATENMFGRYVMGMKEKDFWTAHDVDAMVIAQAALMLLAFGAIFLNASRLKWGWVAGWLGVNGLAFQFGEMVPYAAIVNCAFASLHGQDWYRHGFSMEYKVAAWPVLYSRAGRAVTVLCFFAIAYGAINGFLFGVEGRRIGMGLDPRLRNSIDSTQKELLPGIFGVRVFNVRADQGDMLIWLDRKPYIDSRHALFVYAPTNLAERHRAIRANLFPRTTEPEDEPDIVWQKELADLEMASIVMRLWGEEPAYETFAQIFIQPQWVMTALGAAGAVFSRADIRDNDLLDHVRQHDQTNFFASAFAKNKTTVRKLQEHFPSWPNPPSDYDRWLIQKLTVRPNSIQLARHYFELASLLRQAVHVRVIGALAELSLQNANLGIQEQPNSDLGYRLIRDNNLILGDVESQLIIMTGQNGQLPMRMRLGTYAAFHAARASADDPEDLVNLFRVLRQQNVIDVALEVAQLYVRRTGKPMGAGQTDDPAAIEASNQELDALKQHVQIVEEQIAEARADSTPLLQLVQLAVSRSCPGLALSLLEEDLTLIAGDPALQLNYANLLLQCGRISDGWEQLETMSENIEKIEQMNDPRVGPMIAQWRELCGYANLGVHNPLRAVELWSQKVIDENRTYINNIASMAPLVANPSLNQDLWPAISTFHIAIGAIGFPDTWATFQLQNAFVRIDSGLIDDAIADLERILEVHPEYPLRPLVVLTLVSLTGKEYDINPPSDQIPVWSGMFADDEPTDSSAASPAIENSTPDTTAEPSENSSRPPPPERPEELQ